MGTVVRLVSSERIEREAAQWVARFDSGEISHREREEFEHWLKSEPLHARAFEELGGVWNQMNALKPANAASMPVLRSYRGALAAAALLAVVAAAAVLLSRNIPADRTLLVTRVGEHKMTRLEDGSLVNMNTDSLVEVEYSGARRNLRLLRGEAYFDVAPNPARPFVVRVGDGAVRAIGTAFTVRYGAAGAVEVTVSNGRVQISSDGTDAQQNAVNPADVDDVTGMGVLAAVDAGQRARFDSRIRSIEPVDSRQLSNELAWRDGMLSLDGKTLGEAVQEVSRYTDVRISIVDSKLREQPVGGYFRLGDTRALVSALEGNFGLQAHWIDNRTVTLAAAQP